jgi:hypothetical protein
MDRQDCADRVGTAYVVGDGVVSFDALLDSVDDGPGGGFSLVIRTGREVPPVQGTYLVGPKGSVLEPVFLVPFAGDDSGFRFCATFSPDLSSERTA